MRLYKNKTDLSLENRKILYNQKSCLYVIMKTFVFTCYILYSVRKQAQSYIFCHCVRTTKHNIYINDKTSLCVFYGDILES